MPRTATNLDTYRSEIEHRVFVRKQRQPKIVEWLNEQGVIVSRQTLQRRCKEWGATRRAKIQPSDPALIEAIENEFNSTEKKDEAIAASLASRGILTSRAQVKAVRIQHAWRRRASGPSEGALQRRETFRKVEELLARNPPRTSRQFVIPELRERYHYKAREADVRDALRYYIRGETVQLDEADIAFLNQDDPRQRLESDILGMQDNGTRAAVATRQQFATDRQSLRHSQMDTPALTQTQTDTPPAPWPAGKPRPVSKQARASGANGLNNRPFPVFEVPTHLPTAEARHRWLATAREMLFMLETDNRTAVPTATLKAALSTGVDIFAHSGQWDDFGRGYTGTHAYQ